MHQPPSLWCFLNFNRVVLGRPGLQEEWKYRLYVSVSYSWTTRKRSWFVLSALVCPHWDLTVLSHTGRQTNNMSAARSVWRWDTGPMNAQGRGNMCTDHQERLSWKRNSRRMKTNPSALLGKAFPSVTCWIQKERTPLRCLRSQHTFAVLSRQSVFSDFMHLCMCSENDRIFFLGFSFWHSTVESLICSLRQPRLYCVCHFGSVFIGTRVRHLWTGEKLVFSFLGHTVICSARRSGWGLCPHWDDFHGCRSQSGTLALKLNSGVVRHSVPWSVKNISFNGDTVLFRKWLTL